MIYAVIQYFFPIICNIAEVMPY